MPTRARKPYKPRLSMFQIKALSEQHKHSPFFRKDRNGDTIVEPWLRELRYREACQVAEMILGSRFDEAAFQTCWARTEGPVVEEKRSELPNTATFGGFRLRTRSALDRRQKQQPRTRKKK